MGQGPSSTTNELVDTVSLEVRKHTKVFQEIGNLTYDEFKKCLEDLNELSRRCLDTNGKQLVFLVKKGTDTSMLWKATVRIGCVKVDPLTRQIENYKFLNLKQFLCVFRTFQNLLQTLMSSEDYAERRGYLNVSASVLLDHVNGITETIPKSPSDSDDESDKENFSECCICLERKTEVLLPCTHVFCAFCIEQWNENNKSCPICSEKLESTRETWELMERPGIDEISDNICNELMNLSKDVTKK